LDDDILMSDSNTNNTNQNNEQELQSDHVITLSHNPFQ
jgi:hypothetical protein